MPVNNDSKMFANVCERRENYIISSKPQNILDKENNIAIIAIKAHKAKMERIMNKHINVSIAESKNRRLTALDKAAWLREQIYNRKKENMHDSSRNLHRIRKARGDEF